MTNMKDQKPLRIKVISMGNAEAGKVFTIKFQELGTLTHFAVLNSYLYFN